MKRGKCPEYHFFPYDKELVVQELGREVLIEQLGKMLLIRNFEIRAESAYQQGKIGGFFHAYTGQEAVQTSCLLAFGEEHWYTTTYRCHALALLLGCTPNEVMAEFYGKETGNAKGRGGSMHLYAPRLLGGFGIVGGHVPVATGAGFTIKYLKKEKEASLCFLGDGAVVQGAVHEAFNLASLWDLPCVYVVENNQWGMGTAVNRAVCVQPIAEKKASGYNMKSYTLDGMDFFSCYAGFKHVREEVLQTQRPVLVEAVTERFKGHSISDPGLYRSKDELQQVLQKDPIHLLKQTLIEKGFLNDEEFKQMDKEKREIVIESMDFAEKSSFPDPVHLEEDVLAP
jgi:pyruvate dehydrogenase E1 component alpha subunit